MLLLFIIIIISLALETRAWPSWGTANSSNVESIRKNDQFMTFGAGPKHENISFTFKVSMRQHLFDIYSLIIT